MEKWTMEELQRKDIATFKASEKTPIIVLLDNVRSMHNVGSVFRTCDGFAIEKIFLCGFTPQPPHREIQKTALGATETVGWEHCDNIITVLQQLKNDGITIVAIEQVKGSIALQDFSREGKIAVIFGNEVDGVSNEALALCDAAIEIPQVGTKHSFNISVAAGIVLWQLFKKK